jgi:phosphoglycerate dehydrogenase-like enzyme
LKPGKSLPIVLISHTLPKEWISILEEGCQLFTGPPDATELDPTLIDLLPDAEGLFTLLTIPVTEKILQRAPNLRVVSNMAVGVDNIDLIACTRRKIPVGNTPGVLTESTADLTMALILSSARNLPKASLDAREGRWKTWSPAGWLGIELNNSILGIVGMGKIGRAVAKRAMSFGMKILFSDPEQSNLVGGFKVSLDYLFQQSDFVSLHAPLTSDTRSMINQTTLSKMKPSAILINAARGSLVETSALVEALQNHRISAAALDVTDPEPLPPTHPLFGLDNCLIVPHIGSATQQTRCKMAELACKNLLAGLEGKRLPFCVNPEVYSTS